MDFPTVENETLVSLSVKLDGNWLELPKREWQGTAIASEPLVAVVFLKQGNVVEWCKSSRQAGEGLQVKFALGAYDEFNLEVQVYFSIGQGDRRFASVVKSPEYRPNIGPHSVIKTGEIIKFASVEGSMPIDLYALFIAQRNIKFGRNGLWHIRAEVKDFLPVELSRILEFGRKGKATASKLF